MAKVTAPLLSFDASGQIGKSMVVASTRGVKYARQYVIPANPQTTAQQANRTRFAFLREMYKRAPADVLAPWNAYAQGRKFYGFNAFVGENNRLLRGQSDLQNMEMSPGARGGIPPVSVTATTGSSAGEVDVEVIGPSTLPVGWSITEYGAAAVHDVDPVSIFDGVIVADVDAGPDPTITLTGLGAAENCVAFGWIVYEKPDGSAAYSVSVADTATSGA